MRRYGRILAVGLAAVATGVGIHERLRASRETLCRL